MRRLLTVLTAAVARLMNKGELTPLESRLVECAAAGEELDCAPTGATAAELDEIDDWYVLPGGHLPGWAAWARPPFKSKKATPRASTKATPDATTKTTRRTFSS